LAVEAFRSATRDGSSLGRDSIVDIGIEQSRELLRDGPRLGEETAIAERGERPAAAESWVTMTIVFSSSLLRRPSRSRISAAALRSRSLVGSSATMS
jgi:hypothetical protein